MPAPGRRPVFLRYLSVPRQGRLAHGVETVSTALEWLVPLVLLWIGLLVVVLGAVRAGARNDAVVDATFASEINEEEESLLELEAMRSPSGSRFFPSSRSRRKLAALLVGLKMTDLGLGAARQARRSRAA